MDKTFHSGSASKTLPAVRETQGSIPGKMPSRGMTTSEVFLPVESYRQSLVGWVRGVAKRQTQLVTKDLETLC